MNVHFGLEIISDTISYKRDAVNQAVQTDGVYVFNFFLFYFFNFDFATIFSPLLDL